VVLELEGLSAALEVALELSQLRAVGVVRQVALQLRQVRKLLRADGARLERENKCVLLRQGDRMRLRKNRPRCDPI
jgi:hypothetical protein